MRDVPLADHGDGGDLAVGRQTSLVVGLGQLGVQPLHHHLRDRRGLPHPDRGGDDDDVGLEELGADRRPEVTVPLVRADPEPDAVVNDPDDFAGDAVFAEGVEQVLAQPLRAGGGGLRA